MLIFGAEPTGLSHKSARIIELARLVVAASQPNYKLLATGALFGSKDLFKVRGYRRYVAAREWCCSVGQRLGIGVEVYVQRRSQAAVEVLDAMTRYSLRTGHLSTE